MENESKKILALALPMIATQLLWMTMPVVDTLMVGHLGPKALASMAIATTYYWLLQLVCFGIMSSLNPLVSHAHGQNKKDELRPLIHSGLMMAILISTGMILAVLMGKPVLLLLGQSPEFLEGADEYLRAVVWGIPFQMGFMAFRQFCDSMENPKPSIVLVSIGAFINAVLDYGLIYGKFGFSPLGVSGAGFATAFTQVFLCMGMGVYLTKSSRYRFLKLWEESEVSRRRLAEMLKLGLPSSGSMVAEMSYFSGSTLIMGLLGVTEVASHQIALNVASVTFMIPLGVAIASSVRVGAYAGRQDWSGVRAVATRGLLICLGLGVFNAAALVVFAPLIVGFYQSDPQVKLIATQLIRIAGIFQIFDGLQVLGIHLLRGLKDTRVPFMNTLFSFGVIGMGLSLYLTFEARKGPVGFWTGMIVSLAVAALLHQIRFKKLSAK